MTGGAAFAPSPSCRPPRLADVFRTISFFPGETYGPHSHVRIEINHVTAGSCTLHLPADGSRMAFRRGDTMIISSGIDHRFQAGRRGATLLQLEMRPDVLEWAVDGGPFPRPEIRFAPSKPVMCISGDSRVRSTIQAIVWELANRQPGYEPAVLLNYAQLLILLGRHSSAPEASGYPRSLATALAAIRRDAFGPVDIGAVAAEAGVTDRQLRKLFASHIGYSPAAYVARLRIDRATAMLTSGEHSVKEVCFACGFASPQYFSRAFRKATGQPPAALLGRKVQL